MIVYCLTCETPIRSDQAVKHGGGKFVVYLCRKCDSRRGDEEFLSEFAKKLMLEVALSKLPQNSDD